MMPPLWGHPSTGSVRINPDLELTTMRERSLLQKTQAGPQDTPTLDIPPQRTPLCRTPLRRTASFFSCSEPCARPPFHTTFHFFRLSYGLLVVLECIFFWEVRGSRSKAPGRRHSTSANRATRSLSLDSWKGFREQLSESRTSASSTRKVAI